MVRFLSPRRRILHLPCQEAPALLNRRHVVKLMMCLAKAHTIYSGTRIFIERHLAGITFPAVRRMAWHAPSTASTYRGYFLQEAQFHIVPKIAIDIEPRTDGHTEVLPESLSQLNQPPRPARIERLSRTAAFALSVPK